MAFHDPKYPFREVKSQRVVEALKRIGAARAEKASFYPAFQDLETGLGQLDAALQKVADWRAYDGSDKNFGIVYQIRFVIREVDNLCDQYLNPKVTPTLTFREPFILRLNRSVAQVNRLTTVITDKVARNAVSLYKVDGLPLVITTPLVDFASQLRSEVTTGLALSMASNVSNPYLMKAATGRWVELDEALLTNREHATDAGPYFSLLHMAVMWQDLYAVAMLLSYGADINCRTRGDHLIPAGSTPLHLAMALCNVPVLKLLLCWNPDRSIVDNQNRSCDEVPSTPACLMVLTETPQLQQAAQNACCLSYRKQFRNLRTFVTHDPIPLNVKFKPDSKYGLIHQVAYGGDLETYLLVVEAGAAPLLRTSEGLLPSAVAEAQGHTHVASVMLAREEAFRTHQPQLPPPTDPISPSNAGFSREESGGSYTRSLSRHSSGSFRNSLSSVRNTLSHTVHNAITSAKEATRRSSTHDSSPPKPPTLRRNTTGPDTLPPKAH